MTWGEWIDSSYNTGEYYNNYGFVAKANQGYVADNNLTQSYYNLIIANGVYKTGISGGT